MYLSFVNLDRYPFEKIDGKGLETNSLTLATGSASPVETAISPDVLVKLHTCNRVVESFVFRSPYRETLKYLNTKKPRIDIDSTKGSVLVSQASRQSNPPPVFYSVESEVSILIQRHLPHLYCIHSLRFEGQIRSDPI